MGNLNAVKSVPLERPLPSFSKIAFSDASQTGCGGYLQGIAGTELVQKWNLLESVKSSASREC